MSNPTITTNEGPEPRSAHAQLPLLHPDALERTVDDFASPEPAAVYGFSLYQPYATLVVLGLKQFDTRPWRTTITGPIYIHAAKHFPASTQALLTQPHFAAALAPYGYATVSDFPTAAIIGKVTIVRCQPTSDAVDHITDTERAFGDYSAGRYAFRLRNPISFPAPFPCRANRRFWKLPRDIITQLEEVACQC